MDFVFSLIVCANGLVDSFPYKYMSCLWSLTWSKRVLGNWYLITWLEITVRNSAMETDLKKWLFGSFFLDNWFQNHPDSVIQQKCQSRSSQSFKHKSAHIPSLNSTANFSFEPRFGMFVINRYYTKTKHL